MAKSNYTTQNIIQILKQAALPFAACACTLILTGCESSGDFNQFASVMGGAAGMSTGENAQTLNMLAGVSANAGQQQQQLEIQQQQQQQQDAYATQQVLGHGAYVFDDSVYGKLYIVTCNAGSGCDPNNFNASKYTNVKTVFSKHEPLEIHVGATSPTSGWGYTITDQNGNAVKSNLSVGTFDCWHTDFSESLQPGNYAYNLYINNSLRKKVYFRVTEN